MTLTRRTVLKATGWTACGLVAGGTGAAGIYWTRFDVDTVGKIDFNRPLAIPPLADMTTGAGGVLETTLRMTAGRSDLGRSGPTETWGFNGPYLGPTIRARRGETVAVRVVNELQEASSVHWHGMHLPAEMDGGPHQPVDAGGTWEATWTIDQPAATLWYHPHPHGNTAHHVYRGLTGMFIVDDLEHVAGGDDMGARSVGTPSLPSEYGVDDLPVIIQDKSFDGDALDFGEPAMSNSGILGDAILVNGTPAPFFDVTTERVRLRILNASNARIYRLRFADDRQMLYVGSDGGLLARPVPVEDLWLSPGERVEVVVSLAPREDLVLRAEKSGSRGGGRLRGGDDRFDVLLLRAGAELRPSPEPVPDLAQAPNLQATADGMTRRFDLAGTKINEQRMDMSRIDFGVPVDTVERWVVRNTNGYPHNFHVHGAQFVIESANNDQPEEVLRGWKDTVLVPANSEVALLLRFAGYTDPEVPYMYHCHLLRHEDEGMMGQFVVLDEDESLGTSAGDIHSSMSH